MFLGLKLCSSHILHLLEIRKASLSTLNESSFADLAVLREAQGLTSPGRGAALTGLEGGA